MSQRFSDAELAAEYWHAKARASSIEANGYSPHYHLADAETFHRFATLPHAHPELARKSALSPRIESGLADPISSLEKALVRKLRQQRKNLVKPSTKEMP